MRIAGLGPLGSEGVNGGIVGATIKGVVRVRVVGGEENERPAGVGDILGFRSDEVAQAVIE